MYNGRLVWKEENKKQNSEENSKYKNHLNSASTNTGGGLSEHIHVAWGN